MSPDLLSQGALGADTVTGAGVLQRTSCGSAAQDALPRSRKPPRLTTPARIIEHFKVAMREMNITPPESIVADDKIHRFPTSDSPGNTAGWYILRLKGYGASGGFGDWRLGVAERWSYGKERGGGVPPWRSDSPTASDRCRPEDRGRTSPWQRAMKIWNDAKPAPPNHPYLTSHRVGVHGIRMTGGVLTVPIGDDSGVCSLQFIGAGGSKRFMRGGVIKGKYFLLGLAGPEICIAEGYATAAAIFEATGIPTAVAFSAGNLLPVALSIKRQWPEANLTICADDDRQTPGNPGLTHARAAARAVNARMAVPVFRDDESTGTDFNDLQELRGAQAVRDCIAAAETYRGNYRV